LFMSSGKLVKNYTVLEKYFDLLEKMGIDKSLYLPSSSDMDFVVRLVSSGRKKLLDVLEELIARIVARVHREAAKEAVREALGSDIDEEIAVDIVARDIAGWILEIAENMGLIKIDSNIIR